MADQLKTAITNLIKEGAKYEGVYDTADTAIATLADEEKYLTSKAVPMWREIFGDFTIDELVEKSGASKDRIERLIKEHSFGTKGQSLISGMDYSAITDFSTDNEIPNTLKEIREKIHLHERFMSFRGETNNAYLKGRGDELKRIERQLATKYSQLMKEFKAEGFSYSKAKEKANAIIKAEYDVLELKLDRKYPTSFEGHEMYSVFKDQKV